MRNRIHRMTRLTRRIINRVYAIIVERILYNSDTEMIKEFYEAIEKRAEQIEQIKRYHQMTLLDKWASPVPSNRFADLDDLWRTLEDFRRFCNIVEPPVIQRGLFI